MDIQQEVQEMEEGQKQDKRKRQAINHRGSTDSMGGSRKVRGADPLLPAEGPACPCDLHCLTPDPTRLEPST